MNPPGRVNKNSSKAMSRHEFLRLLAAALESHSFRFARLAALNWLASFPGDLQVLLALGEAQQPRRSRYLKNAVPWILNLWKQGLTW
jgi:hypothetical protein